MDNEDILIGLSIGRVMRWSGDITFYLSTVSQRPWPWILENLNTNEKTGNDGTTRVESNSTRPTLIIFNHLVLLLIFPLAFMILAV